MVHLFNAFIELRSFVTGKPTIWEDTDGCVKYIGVIMKFI